MYTCRISLDAHFIILNNLEGIFVVMLSILHLFMLILYITNNVYKEQPVHLHLWILNECSFFKFSCLDCILVNSQEKSQNNAHSGQWETQPIIN